MLNIINPLTNNTYSLFSKLGKETLKKYIIQYQTGGSKEAINELPFDDLTNLINNKVLSEYRKYK